MIVLLIVCLISLGVSAAALYRTSTIYSRLQRVVGEDIDTEKLLRKLELHQLRQKDLKKRTDTLTAIQKANQNLLDESLKRVGLVRFNPYRDTGGDQSFSLCILNSEHNGFILTTIHGREGTRVYAKPITSGKSEYDLSSEESEALKKALV